MPIRHLVSSLDLSRAEYDEISRRYQKFIKEGISPDLCRGKIAATLFFQPSTRTMNMFQSAMLRAGGGWIGVTGTEALSMEKGETLEETIREYGSFADVIALRHPDDNSAQRAAGASFVPVFNCGSGSREHAVAGSFVATELPELLGRPFDGLKVGFYGTPQINRAAKGLLPVLGLFNVDVMVDDLGSFPFPDDVAAKAKEKGLKSLTYGKLDDFIGDVDVLFVTRGLQKGIIPPDQFPKEKEEEILKKYKPINTEHMKKLRKDAILYMLKPRIFEIEKEVDADPRSVYVRQEKYVECALALVTFFLGIEI